MASDGIPMIPGLTKARWCVYCAYRDARRPVTISDVADALGKSRPTVSEQVSWLVEHELLIEHPSAGYAGQFTAADDPWEVAKRLHVSKEPSHAR